MGYSMRQAADVCGKSRTTIHRALKSGRMSGTQDNTTGEWSIDPSELRRVFPWDRSVHEHKSTNVHDMVNSTSDEVLAVKVAMLENQLEREKETVSDLRKRLDLSDERLTLLTHQIGSNTKVNNSWLSRLLKK